MHNNRLHADAQTYAAFVCFAALHFTTKASPAWALVSRALQGIAKQVMRREAVVEHIELNPLGEFRMGCDAYGMTIKTNFGEIETFRDVPVMIGQTDHSKFVEQSSCKGYLLIKGAFATYIVDIKDQTISVYRATVRGVNNEWCDENPIYGKETCHVQGFSRHYHLQFPFVRKDRFHQVFGDYEALRRRQIQELTNAL